MCDGLVSPGDTVYPMQQLGDYHTFSNDENLKRAIKYISEQQSEYAFSGPIAFTVDETLKADGLGNDFDMPKKYRKEIIEYLEKSNPGKYKQNELKNRRHNFYASLRAFSHLEAFDFANYNHKLKKFVMSDVAKRDGAFSTFVQLLIEANESSRCLVFPFDSYGIMSAHMCTIIVQPTRRKGGAIVHVFDPNGVVPAVDDTFPFCTSYRAAIHSALTILFGCQSVFINVSIEFEKTPNFNMPGAAPRSIPTSEDADVDKLFLSYKVDKYLGLLYRNESNGVCAVVSLFVMCMAMCFGKRCFNETFWKETLEKMSGKSLDKKYRMIGKLDRNKHLKGDMILHKVYNRLMYMRAFAWSLYKQCLSKSQLGVMGVNTPLLMYNKKTGQISEFQDSL